MSWKCEKRAFFLDFPCVISVHYRPFLHSCQQSHQLKAWVDKNQWFVWNCIHPSLDCSTPFLYVFFLEQNAVKVYFICSDACNYSSQVKESSRNLKTIDTIKWISKLLSVLAWIVMTYLQGWGLWVLMGTTVPYYFTDKLVQAYLLTRHSPGM